MSDGEREEENKWDGNRTYAAFADAHRFGAPLVANGALKFKEPRVRQISEPPIGRVVHSHLLGQRQKSGQQGSKSAGESHWRDRDFEQFTLIVLAEFSASNDARRCCMSSVQTVSSTWSGTMRSDT